MDIAELISELSVFPLWPRAFSLHELLDFVGQRSGRERLRSALDADPRFMCLRSAEPGEDTYIQDTTLFRWFTDLNIRLTRVQQYRLDERQLALVMSKLRLDGRWHSAPSEAIRWGESLGLIGRACAAGQYVFPLARVLSFFSDLSLRVTKKVLEELTESEVWNLPLDDMTEEHVQQGFSHFDQRTVQIVQGRTGLLTGTEMTLAQAGSAYGITRERTRQLEERFWYRLRRPGPSRDNRRSAFVTAMLCDFMAEGGSLIVPGNSRKGPLRRFLAKCVAIPQLTLREHGMVVLGVSAEELGCLGDRDWFPEEVEADAIASRLESEARTPLVASDVRAVCESIAGWRRRRLKLTQRVYVTMRAIGQPAHYSEIADVHNMLFPDRASSERNIHGALNRAEYGVVWIGAKGTYALQEWGYERPSATLSQTVAEIVQQKYSETGRPVPFLVIAAEVGKHRAIVKPTSVTIAAHCNDQLERLHGNRFVPKGVGKGSGDDPSAEELDRILREFQEGRTSSDSRQDQRDSTGREGDDREGEEDTMGKKPRTCYKYHFKVGNRIVHRGITEDLQRRAKEHEQKWPNGHIKQVGRRTTEDAAERWEDKGGKG